MTQNRARQSKIDREESAKRVSLARIGFFCPPSLWALPAKVRASVAPALCQKQQKAFRLLLNNQCESVGKRRPKLKGGATSDKCCFLCSGGDQVGADFLQFWNSQMFHCCAGVNKCGATTIWLVWAPFDWRLGKLPTDLVSQFGCLTFAQSCQG